MRRGLILLLALLASPAAAQDTPAPTITPEETAAAVAAVEAANLAYPVYLSLWCAGLFAQQSAASLAAAEPGAAQVAAEPRDALYRRAAADLLATGMTEAGFTAIAENMYRVVQSQTNAGSTAREFSNEQCAEVAGNGD